MVAHYAAQHFQRIFLQHLPVNASAADFVANATVAFETALLEIDAEIGRLAEVQSGQDQSGSTSVMTLVTPKHIICANTGDSRAVLSRDGVAVALSFDHKPFNPEEKDRIENAGGTVKFNRVNGDLAVSRALGDFVYKRCDTAGPKQQAVTAFPEMIAETRDSGKEEFIVLACDGIWDVMSSQEVVDKVRELIRNGRPERPAEESMGAAEQSGEQETPQPPKPRPWDLGAVCEELIDHCLKLGSRDNMSVVIVALQPGWKPSPEAAAGSS